MSKVQKKSIDTQEKGNTNRQPESLIKRLDVQELPEVNTASSKVEQIEPKEDIDTISIHRDVDGNFSGKIYKFDKWIEVRGISPDEVLKLLLTHS